MEMHITYVCVSALFLRIFFVYLGSYIDNSQDWQLQYTDIDYHVYSDAAKLLRNGQSPYERTTYRYPPVFAALLQINSVCPEAGKLLFSVADVVVVYLIYCVLRKSVTEKTSVGWALAWALNPMAVNICTRGSADSVTNGLVLLTVLMVNDGRTLLAGLVLGAVTHLRIYPLIYVPAVMVNVCCGGAGVAATEAVADGGRIEETNSKPNTYETKITPALVFLAGFLAALGTLGAVAYAWCGREYLQEAVLYHLGRADHRHNFSAHFYWMYLAGGAHGADGTALGECVAASGGTCAAVPGGDWFDWVVTAGGSLVGHARSACHHLTLSWPWPSMHSSCGAVVDAAARALLFGPQAVLMAAITHRYARRDLGVCLLLLTVALVSYNKVATAQYFTWFACLLPLCAPVLCRKVPLWPALCCGALWCGSLGLWLYHAYQLEFEGRNTFLATWAAGMLFHAANTACVAVIAWFV